MNNSGNNNTIGNNIEQMGSSMGSNGSGYNMEQKNTYNMSENVEII